MAISRRMQPSASLCGKRFRRYRPSKFVYFLCNFACFAPVRFQAEYAPGYCSTVLLCFYLLCYDCVITVQCTTLLYCNALYYTVQLLHYTLLRCGTELHSTILYGYCTTLYHAALLYYTVLQCITLYCTEMRCTALDCTTLHTLHCTEIDYKQYTHTPLHYTTLHCTTLHYNTLRTLAYQATLHNCREICIQGQLFFNECKLTKYKNFRKLDN